MNNQTVTATASPDIAAMIDPSGALQDAGLLRVATAPRIQVSIPHNIIRALLLIVPKADVRYYLQGVAIDTTGPVPVAVATDGHRLLAVRLPDAHASDAEDGAMPRGVWIVPRAVLASVKPVKGGKARIRKAGERHYSSVQIWEPIRITIAPDAQATVRVSGDTTAECACIDGRYPDWRRVVPTKASGKLAQYNGQYIADFCEAAQLLSGSNCAQANIGHNGDGAALVDLYHEDSIGVLMPCRMDPAASERPEWIG